MLGAEIRDYIRTMKLLFDQGYDLDYVGASSYDLRVGAKGVLGGTAQVVNLREEILELVPGAYAGVISAERVKLPKRIFARLGAKRRFSYEGIILLTGELVDPGYEGYLLFGLYNASPTKYLLRAGEKLCSIVFERLAGEAESAPPVDPRLSVGDFPVEFLHAMDRKDIGALSQIGARLGDTDRKLVEALDQLRDLKTQFDDKFRPIEELRRLNEGTAQNIRLVSQQLDQLQALVGENSKQITENSRQISVLGSDVGGIDAKANTLGETVAKHGEKLEEARTELRSSLTTGKIALGIIWTLLSGGIGAILLWAIGKVLP
jgi:deoxycytidine triphosphate deaminase